MAATDKPQQPQITQHTFKGVLYDSVFPPEILESIQRFEFDPTDVLVAGYPKTGTTWLQEIVWLIQNGADTKSATSIPIMQRCPLMELLIPMKTSNLEMLKSKPSPRIMNTHLQYNLLEVALENGRPKVIVILRNPKDTLVSYYHFYNTRQGFEPIPTFSKFFEIFKEKNLVFGDWFDHAKGWFSNRRKEHFHVICYEDMKEDHAAAVERLAEFLGRELTADQVHRIVDHTSLKSMKSRKSAKMGSEDAKVVVDESKSAFVRKGVVGDWKNHFTSEESQYVNDLLSTACLPYDESTVATATSQRGP